MPDLHSALARIAEARPQLCERVPASGFQPKRFHLIRRWTFPPHGVRSMNIVEIAKHGVPQSPLLEDHEIEGVLLGWLLSLSRTEDLSVSLHDSPDRAEVEVWNPADFIPSSRRGPALPLAHVDRPEAATALALALAQALDSDTP